MCLHPAAFLGVWVFGQKEMRERSVLFSYLRTSEKKIKKKIPGDEDDEADEFVRYFVF